MSELLSEYDRELVERAVRATLEELIECAEAAGHSDVADWLRGQRK